MIAKYRDYVYLYVCLDVRWFDRGDDGIEFSEGSDDGTYANTLMFVVFCRLCTLVFVRMYCAPVGLAGPLPRLGFVCACILEGIVSLSS